MSVANVEINSQAAELELVENLRRCNELLAILGPRRRTGVYPGSAQLRHLEEKGHWLEFGCCSKNSTTTPIDTA